MTIEQLRKIHQIRPFQAFDIHLADGRSIPVSHPELLAFSPPDETFAAGMPGGNIETVKRIADREREAAPAGLGPQR